MKNFFYSGALLILFIVGGCQDKKTDYELFKEGPPKISLSADVIRGYDPLIVNFAAYLETASRPVEKEIKEIKWTIRGPDGYLREVIQESHNFQEEGSNEDNSFYFEYQFIIPGVYRVQVALNGGQFRSVPVRIVVVEHPSRRGRE